MRSKFWRILLALYLLLWFGVVVPGHRRGIVTIGPPDPAQTCSCCQCPDCAGTPSKPSDTPPSQASHCAICDFAAHLTLPPTFDFTLPPLGLLDRLPDPVIADLVSRFVLIPFDGRGPPAIG